MNNLHSIFVKKKIKKKSVVSSCRVCTAAVCRIVQLLQVWFVQPLVVCCAQLLCVVCMDAGMSGLYSWCVFVHPLYVSFVQLSRRAASRDISVDDLVEGVKQEVKVSADLLDPPRL